MDFTHVSDVVQANMLAMTSPACNEAFNVGTGVSTTIKELADILINALGSRVQPEFSGRPTLVSRRRADLTKIRNLLGYEPRMEVRRGLTEVAQAIAAHPELY
jgi:UDP-glucose 4-epimerase